MFEASHNNALLYGLACVLLALFTGWLAGVDLPAGLRAAVDQRHVG